MDSTVTAANSGHNFDQLFSAVLPFDYQSFHCYLYAVLQPLTVDYIQTLSLDLIRMHLYQLHPFLSIQACGRD